MGRTCIFCPHKADSQEHIWSKWILDLLPDAKDGIFTRRLADGTEKMWRTAKPELTVGKVCELNCNNGWMSRKLEMPMQAATSDIIIENTRKTFSNDQCAVIAAWAFKTTILANHIDLVGEPFFSVQQRRSFARDLTIPKGVHVWLARRNAGHLTARYMSSRRVLQPPMPLAPHLRAMPVSPYRFEIYDCVFSIGYLLLQVVAARWTERKITNLINFPPIEQGEFFKGYAIPIWPSEGGVTAIWPPTRAIGNDLFGVFCARFDQFSIPPWMTE